MTKTFKSYLALSFLLATSFPALAETPSTDLTSPSLRITLRFYDYVQVGPRTRERAQEVATRIFRKAGIETDWLNCSLGQSQIPPECDQLLGPADLALRIVPRPKNARMTFRSISCGFAVRPTTGGTGGALISLFSDCVDRTANEQGLSRGMALGYLAAHEIGHQLLGSGKHSSAGLMRAKFRRKEWTLAKQSTLLFTRREAEQLQAGVLARNGQ